MIFKVILVLLATFVSFNYGLPCALRRYEHGYVCVCNSTYCDTFDTIYPKTDEFISVSSTHGGLRFNVYQGYIETEVNTLQQKYLKIPYCLKKKCQKVEESVLLNLPLGFMNITIRNYEKVMINVNPTVKHQIFHGFGGAYTGSSAELVHQMPDELKSNFYRSYYSKNEGIGFRYMRITIGGSDSDRNYWAYNEVPENDIELSNFTELHAVDKLRVSQINELQEVSRNYKIKILASAWSPPFWMKTNGKYYGLGFLKMSYYQTWADYQIKFIELMEKNGIKIWALGTTNENVASLLSFMPSLRWSPMNYAHWIANYLGPTLRSSKYNNTLIFLLGGQRSSLEFYYDLMEQANPKAYEYADGIALHWYSDRLLTRLMNDRSVEKLGNSKLLFVAESSICVNYDQHLGPRLGDWLRSLTYVEIIIENLKKSVNGWIDWNLILDETGGQQLFNSHCDAPIILNYTNHLEIYKQPIFYMLGHFSKYLIEDTVIIDVDILYSSSIQAIGFLRPDNLIVLVVNNPFWVQSPVEIEVRANNGKQINLQIPSYSIHTILFWNE